MSDDRSRPARARDQDVAHEHEGIAKDHREAEDHRNHDGNDHQPQRPVAFGDRLEHRNEIENWEREHPEQRREKDQQAPPGSVGDWVEQALAPARILSAMAPPHRAERFISIRPRDHANRTGGVGIVPTLWPGHLGFIPEANSAFARQKVHAGCETDLIISWSEGFCQCQRGPHPGFSIPRSPAFERDR